MPQQFCVLCGQPANPYNRPGTPTRCSLHSSKDLDAGETFSQEEAYQLGVERANSISLSEMEAEGKQAFQQLQKAIAAFQTVPEDLQNLRNNCAEMIAAKRAYLKAFD